MRVWAVARLDVRAIGLVGSWARNDARMDSDVDLVLLATEESLYLEDESWTAELGGVRIVNTEQWGPVTERRFILPSGLEVEMGIAPPSWAAADPADPGTRRVVRDGMVVLHDPEGLLARLVETCSESAGG